MANVLDNLNDIELFSVIALKGALSLELKGMTRHGRSAYAIAKDRFGLKGSKQKVYDQLCTMIEETKAARVAA